jgi:hypothetical protein
VGLERRQVDVVEDDHEGSDRADVLGRVGGHPRRRRRYLGGLVRQHDALETDDLLRFALVEHLEIRLIQRGDGNPLLVGHHDVHRDLLDLRREGRGLPEVHHGRRRRSGGLGLLLGHGLGKAQQRQECERWSERSLHGGLDDAHALIVVISP